MWRSPTSKSFGSWLGVIFTQPVPYSISTYSSSIKGIFLPTTGKIKFLPILSLNLGSSGFTATARSPNIVSGRVVAIVIYSSLSSKKYLMYQRLPSFSTW